MRQTQILMNSIRSAALVLLIVVAGVAGAIGLGRMLVPQAVQAQGNQPAPPRPGLPPTFQKRPPVPPPRIRAPKELVGVNPPPSGYTP